jgi:ribose/xylose/arabinose/galactoside ABC-type transport system permease subunit
MKKLPPWGWAAIVLVAVLLFNAAFTPGFFDITFRDGRFFGSLVDILNRAAPVAILALGMTLVIATGGIDLSVGAVMAIAGAVAAGMIAPSTGTPFQGGKSQPALAVPAATLAGVFAGSLNGLLVAVLEFQPIVATLLLMVTGRGIAQLLANGQIVTFVEPSFAAIGRGSQLGFPNPVWIALLLLCGFGILTRLTGLGLFLEATGSNSTAAKFVGINAKAVKMTVYALSGLCAAVAGLIVTADIQAADANNAGLYLELDAILAVSVGGTALAGGRFSLVGSLVGALLMQAMTTTILTRGVSPEVTLVLKAAVIVAVCLLQAQTAGKVFGLKVKRAEP